MPQMIPPDQSKQQEPQGGEAGPAEQAIQQVQQGFATIGKMMQAAQGKLPPEDAKLFQQAVSAADNFFQSLMGDAGGDGPAPSPKQKPSQPMPENANAGATPAPQY